MQIKQQLIGQSRLSYENLLSQTLGYAKDQLNFEQPFTLSEGEKIIESITAEQLQDAANEIFDPEKLSILIYDPATEN